MKETMYILKVSAVIIKAIIEIIVTIITLKNPIPFFSSESLNRILRVMVELDKIIYD